MGLNNLPNEAKVREILADMPVKEKRCCLCGYDIPEAIEEHHITYDPAITVMLCSNCHRIVTRLDRCQGFYDYERCRDLILRYREIRDVIWAVIPQRRKA